MYLLFCKSFFSIILWQFFNQIDHYCSPQPTSSTEDEEANDDQAQIYFDLLDDVQELKDNIQELNEQIDEQNQLMVEFEESVNTLSEENNEEQRDFDEMQHNAQQRQRMILETAREMQNEIQQFKDFLIRN